MSMRFSDYIRVLKHFKEPIFGSFAVPSPAESIWASSQYKQHLRQKNIPFTTIKHARAYTASEIAAEAKISGHQLAKTVCTPPGSW
jgi:hypothetical protein